MNDTDITLYKQLKNNLVHKAKLSYIKKACFSV